MYDGDGNRMSRWKTGKYISADGMILSKMAEYRKATLASGKDCYHQQMIVSRYFCWKADYVCGWYASDSKAWS